MLTCKDCKDEACPDMGSNSLAGCEDFTSKAIEEESVAWTPTLEDYNLVVASYNAAIAYNDANRKRLEGYEKAVAELVRWAQGQDEPR